MWIRNVPVPCFHQVFTIPHQLNPLILTGERNQRAILKLLFDATAETLQSFGRTTFGGNVGFFLLLHTWDQQLRVHIHLHCLIASGVLVTDGGNDRWVAGGRKFLFPKTRRTWGGVTRQPLSWVVYSKPPFAGPKKLLDYLGRYTHRVAISNDRLVSCDDDQVRFAWRDRRDGDRVKQISIPAEESLTRFLRHGLPDRFQRIRHYGLIANRNKHERLERCRRLPGVTRFSDPSASPDPAPSTLTDWLISVVGIHPDHCPCCSGLLHRAVIEPQPEMSNISPVMSGQANWDTS